MHRKLKAWILLYRMSYIIDDTKSKIFVTPGSFDTFNPNAAYSIGDTVYKDRIESVCIYDAGSQQSWGRYIWTDKNHDLSFYVNGSDWVNSSNYNQSPGTYGYEWGITPDIEPTGITSQSIGNGLNNTNSLINLVLNLNLQPETTGWYIVWDKVQEFRISHSQDWFVPTLNELMELYNQKSLCNNLSTPYWSSSEFSEYKSYFIFFSSGSSFYDFKSNHICRTRLCWYS